MSAASRALWLTASLLGATLTWLCSAAETPQGSHTVVLRNGKELRGTVLNQSLSLRTAYASLTLKKQAIASLESSITDHGLLTVVTVDHYRFTGFLEDRSVSFLPENGTRIELRREQVSRITCSAPGEVPKERSSGTWVRLKNGDLFCGKVVPDPLPVTITNTEVKLDLKNVACLKPVNDGAVGGAGRISTTVLEAELNAEDLAVELNPGQTVSVFRESVAALGHSFAEVSGGLPRGSPALASIQSSPTAPPSPGTTNVEGLVWIPAGEFTMGSPYNETGRDLDEGPQTSVIFPHGFWIGRCEVTQAEYEKLMGTNPSNSTTDPRLPVEKVNWFEAREYCSRLTQRAEADGWLPEGYTFRLPTEAEWEYACRAGTTTRFCCGDDKNESQLGDYAWFTRNSDVTTHPVGSKKPNAWGIHDMHGNVWEWCLDRREGSLPGNTRTNTVRIAEGGLRVARGGSWLYDAKACRSANRDDYGPSNRCSDVGFRVVLAPAGQ